MKNKVNSRKTTEARSQGHRVQPEMKFVGCAKRPAWGT